MSETPEVEILPPEEVIDKAENGEETPARHIGFKTLGIATIMAALFGTIGGAGLSTFFNKAVPDIAPLQIKLDGQVKENTALKAQITKLQKDLRSVPKPKTVDLSGIKNRLSSLEAAEPQTIDPDLIARLEALQSEGSEALDLSDIYTRLEILENRPVATMSANEPSEEMVSDIPVIFPKAEMLASLEDKETSQSWLKKTLNKHISVRAENDPRVIIDAIEMDLENRNIEAAIVKFDSLPETAKTAGRDWRESLGQ